MIRFLRREHEACPRPGATAGLLVRTDASSLSLQLLRCGPESEQTYANDELKGVPGQWRLYEGIGERGEAPSGKPRPCVQRSPERRIQFLT